MDPPTPGLLAALGAADGRILFQTDLAALFKTTRWTIRRWRRVGILPPPLLDGARPRWIAEDLARHLADRRAQAAAAEQQGVIHAP